MVGAPTDTPEVVEQPDEVEEQTPAPSEPETPVIDIGESQDEEAEEAEAPDPVADLKAQITALQEQIASIQTPKGESEESIRERLRLEQEERERDNERAAADRREVETAIKANLIANGVPADLIDASALREATEQVFNKRYDQIANKEISQVSKALKWVRGFAETGKAPSAINGRAAQYAGQLADDFNTIYDRLKAQAQDTADLTGMKAEDLVKRLSADQIKAIHAHESGRLGAQNRNGQKPFKRPEGAAPASGQSELEWWSSLTPEGRRDPANIARFDRYTSSLR